jgi:hypothetical protein
VRRQDYNFHIFSFYASTTDLKFICHFQKTKDVGQMEAIEKLLLKVNDDGQICERHMLNVLSALAVAGSNMTQKVLSNFISKQGDLQHAGALGYSGVCARESIEAAQRVSNPSELLFDTIFSFASQPVRSYECAHQKQIRTIAILTLGSLGRSSRDFSGRNTLLSDSLAARTSAFLRFKFQEATHMEVAEDNIFRRSKMQIHAAFSRASFVMRDHFLARTRSLTR